MLLEHCTFVLASCDTFDCSGQSIHIGNKGVGVSCSGDNDICDAAICCEAPATGDISIAAVSLRI